MSGIQGTYGRRRSFGAAVFVLSILLLAALISPAEALPVVAQPIISAGFFHTCGLTPAGSVECWGRNDFGESDDLAGPFVQISAGFEHSCALTPTGDIHCWGRNQSGESTDQTGPYVQVSAGQSYTCAVKANGDVDCWGYNASNRADDQTGPFTQVSAGWDHTCGLRADGSVFCWGANYAGQAAPKPGPFSQVDVGGGHTCALELDGDIDCWGGAWVGQSADQTGPFTQVSVGGEHSCGLRADGTVSCWGANDSGQSANRADTYLQISSGMAHNCGLKADGSAVCWGMLTTGQSGPFGPYVPPPLPAQLTITKQTNPAGGTGFPFTLASDGPSLMWGVGRGAAGHLSGPYGVTHDAAGNIYVADYSNNRIQKFNAGGDFLRAWGWDVVQGNAQTGFEICLPGDSCQTGVSGSGNGQFYRPRGLVVDAAGDVYVSDENHRVQKFDSEGNYLLKWGSNGTGAGQFKIPWGIAAGGSAIYVADMNNNRVQMFDNAGNYVTQWGSYGSAAGQFAFPSGLAVDPVGGDVYVADRYNQRVQQFDSAGVFKAAWGYDVVSGNAGTGFEICTPADTCQAGIAGSGDGQLNYPGGLDYDAAGNIYVADTNNSRIQKFDSSGNFLTKWGSSGRNNGQFSAPWAVNISITGDVYVADGGNMRIQKFTNAGVYLLQWGRADDPGDFYQPHHAAVDSAGYVYVADTYNHRIQKFDHNGSFVTQWGSYGSGDGQFIEPWGVAVDSAGNVYVTDNGNRRIQKFDSSGNFLLKWGSSGSGNGLFNSPQGITFDSAGDIYVADAGNHRIQKFTNGGVFLTKWGSSGSGDGQLSYPADVAVDSAGTVYVADRDNHRIQTFTSTGLFITKWGVQGTAPGQFNNPMGLDIDGLGHVYVVENDNHRVQKFTDTGDFITTWGSLGTGAGQFSYPRGVVADGLGTIYVVEANGMRVQKFVDAATTLNDDGFITYTLDPATFTISEGPIPGWSLTGIACNGGDPQVSDRSVSLTLPPGGDITCDFTNERPGIITIVKEVVGLVPPTDWIFSFEDLDDIIIPAEGGQMPIVGLMAGDYTVTETAVAGYAQAVSCTSGDSGEGSVTVHLEAGQNVICTFTNTALPGRITIVKEIVGAVPAADWAFTGGLGPFTIDKAGGSKPFEGLTPGNYNFTETAVPGYAQSVTCDSGEGGTGSVTVSLQPGESVTCTFVNTAQPGRITIKKVVFGQTTPGKWSFTGDLGPFELEAGGILSVGNLVANAYTITETVVNGYAAAVECSSGETGGNSVTVNLDPGEEVTCTFTNTAQPGSITIVKEVVGHVPLADWAFTGGLGAFTIDKAGGNKPFPGLAAGSYTVSETAMAGYTRSVSCTSGETGTGSVTVDLAPGENVTCTFTNTAQPGSITVLKDVIGRVPPADWQFTGDLGVFAIVADGGQHESGPLDAGSYTIVETAVTGYTQAVTCDSGETGEGSVTVDLEQGEHVICTFTNTAQPGRVTIVKETMPEDGTEFVFHTDIGEPNPFTLSDNGTDPNSRTFEDVAAGTYGVFEDETWGWTLTNVVCDDDDSTGNVAELMATIQVDPAEHVTCTFSNEQDTGTLVIVKSATPADDTPFDFTHDLPGDPMILKAVGFTLRDPSATTATFSEVPVGEYNVNESDAPGWRLDGISCTGSDWSMDLVSRRLTVTVIKDTTVTCTFTNTAEPSGITVVKEVIGAAPASDWTFTGSLGPFTIDKAGGQKEFEPLDAGEYTVTETAKPGYTQAVSCDNDVTGIGSVTFSLQPGEHVTCIFTNTAQPGSITIIKEVVGPVPPTGWFYTGNLGEFNLPAAGGQQVFEPLNAGEYTVTETGKTGYAQSAVCDSGETGEGSVTVSLQPGENVTCTFTNTAQPGRVTIIKEATPKDGTEFVFTTDITDLSPFTLVDNGVDPNRITFDYVAAGTYLVSENALAGWTLTDVTCDDADSTGNAAGRTATIQVDPGEHVTCTFENEQDTATLIIIKSAAPADDTPFDFTHNLPDDPMILGAVGFTLRDPSATRATFSDVPVGTYDVTEMDTFGWRLEDISCTGTEWEKDLLARNLSVTLTKDATVTCTFTNVAEPGRITIIKNVIGQVPASDWTFTGPFGNFNIPAAGGTNWFTGLLAGEYNFTEAARPGYAQSVTCDSGEGGTGSVTVSLKPGDHVTCIFTNTAQPGRITIVKEVVGPAPSTNWFYSGDLGEFNLPAAGGQQVFEPLDAGEYTVTETGKTGYAQSAVCDSGEAGEGSVTVSLQPGEIVICTFTNTAEPGRITIVKEVVGDVPDDDWAYTGDLGAFALPAAGGQKVFEPLATGSYTINETAVAGYDQSVICDSEETGTGSVTIDLEPGENVICTFINTAQPGRITIIKEVVGQVPATDWDFDGDLGPFTLDAAGGSAGFHNLEAGPYTITEAAVTGYAAKVSCNNGEVGTSSVTVSLQPGENVLCTFTNTAQPGKITIIKEVVGPAPSTNWFYTGDLGEFNLPAAGGQQVFEPLNAGNYTINETAKAGYAQAIVCDSGETGEGSVTVSLQPGEHVICTFTNLAQPGTITVIKEVTGTADDFDWSFGYTGDLGSFILSKTDPGRTFGPLDAGEYSFTETAQPGYSQAVTCNTGETGTGSVTVSLQPGEVVTCTFTNTAEPGSITVVKEVVGQVPADDWAYTGDLGAFTLPAAGGQRVFEPLAAGSYTISETAVAAYGQSVACDSGETGTDSVTVHLQPGDHVTCTFTNSAEPGSITIVKEVVGQVPPVDWAYTGDLGPFTLSAAGGQRVFEPLAAGSYTINETAVAGYDQAVTCTTGETGTGSVTVNLALAEHVTCTFTNTYNPPPANTCQAEYASHRWTDILGIGMGSTTVHKSVAKVVIPNWTQAVELYGQLVAIDRGKANYVRFLYPGVGQYVQVNAITSYPDQAMGNFWYGADLEPKANIRGRWFLQSSGVKGHIPRAFVLYPTYNDPLNTYVNVWDVFHASEGEVYWNVDAGWTPYRRIVVPIAAPLAETPFHVELALVDNDKDQRPVWVTVSAGGVTQTQKPLGPNKAPMLNLMVFDLQGVPAGTNEIVIEVYSPSVAIDGVNGDSVTLVGMAANYRCMEVNRP